MQHHQLIKFIWMQLNLIKTRINLAQGLKAIAKPVNHQSSSDRLTEILMDFFRTKQWTNIHIDFEFFDLAICKRDCVTTGKSNHPAIMPHISDFHFADQGAIRHFPDIDNMVMQTFTGFNKATGSFSDRLGSFHRREITKFVITGIGIELDEVIDIQRFTSQKHLLDDIYMLTGKLGPFFSMWPFPGNFSHALTLLNYQLI
jgi:hypothetical protein